MQFPDGSNRKVIKLDYGFKAYECTIFYDKLKDFVNYKPCNQAKHYIKEELGSSIHLVVIDAEIWTKFISFWQKKMINLSYGFYDPKRNEIMINIKMCGMSANRDCQFLMPPVQSKLQKMSQIVAHEYIHYKFQNKFSKVLNIAENKLLKFYKTYWSSIVDESILKHVYRAHYHITTNTNKNIIDPKYGKTSEIQLDRFIRILDLIQKDHKDKILRDQLFEDTVQTIKSIMKGSLFNSDDVSTNILLAYKSVFNDYPPASISVGQELLYASEILSICANMRSSEAVSMVSRIIKA